MTKCYGNKSNEKEWHMETKIPSKRKKKQLK